MQTTSRSWKAPPGPCSRPRPPPATCCRPRSGCGRRPSSTASACSSRVTGVSPGATLPVRGPPVRGPRRSVPTSRLRWGRPQLWAARPLLELPEHRAPSCSAVLMGTQRPGGFLPSPRSPEEGRLRPAESMSGGGRAGAGRALPAGPLLPVPHPLLPEGPAHAPAWGPSLGAGAAARGPVLPAPRHVWPWRLGPRRGGPPPAPEAFCPDGARWLSGEAAAVDADAVYQHLFSRIPAEHFHSPMLAFEFVQFCRDSLPLFGRNLGVLRTSFPNLFKFLAWNSPPLTSDFVALLPSLVDAGTAVEMLHLLLDLPCLTAALDLQLRWAPLLTASALSPPLLAPGRSCSLPSRASLCTSSPPPDGSPGAQPVFHSAVQPPRPFRVSLQLLAGSGHRDVTVTSTLVSPWPVGTVRAGAESSFGWPGPEPTSEPSLGSLSAHRSLQAASERPPWDVSIRAPGCLEAFRDSQAQGLFQHLLRAQASGTVERLTPLYRLLQPLAGCARVVQCAEAVPTLLRAFFSAVTQIADGALASQLALLLLERSDSLYQVPGYEAGVHRVLSSQFPALCKLHPPLVVEHAKELLEFVGGPRSGGHVLTSVVWAIGEYLSVSWDRRCTVEQINNFFEALEALLFEVTQSRPSTTLPKCPPQVITVLMTTLTKLASRSQDLIPRVSLLLSKMRSLAQSPATGSMPGEEDAGAVRTRATELLNLLKMPSVAQFVFTPSVEVSEPRYHRDTNTALPLVLRTVSRLVEREAGLLPG
ncbi:AP-5 complex subunit zeta-1 isoform X5 [Balaenoptera musculus]|uniref:AP-5 complex subunit zeta-1 isoform X5 n=1 Tax=Balaenoptera musculus TaxID=9771 RepID=A0A8B8VAP6_BALMU|nr:AP-5 complex subunit zeta-1 isoform X5 [Balaenoptera musculus]